MQIWIKLSLSSECLSMSPKYQTKPVLRSTVPVAIQSRQTIKHTLVYEGYHPFWESVRLKGENRYNSSLRVRLRSGILLHNCDTSSREGNLRSLVRLDAENLRTVHHPSRFQHCSIPDLRIRPPEENPCTSPVFPLHLPLWLWADDMTCSSGRAAHTRR